MTEDFHTSYIANRSTVESKILNRVNQKDV